MKNKIAKLVIYLLVIQVIAGCNHNDWFERDPKDILTDEQIWQDQNLILGLLAGYYDRIPAFHGLFDTRVMCDLDDAMYSGHLDSNSTNEFTYGNEYGRYWDYSFIRDLNIGLENLEKYGTTLEEDQKNLIAGEIRFIRAMVYFELVKRMGGVPLVTTTLEYDFNGDPSYLQLPREKEESIYDFIFNELEDIKNDLAGNNGSQTRANTYTALALQSRAMLYAGSIAKYNNLMPVPLQTGEGVVGISASRATEFYNRSLTASRTIIANTATYGLYNEVANKGENFYEMLNSKDGNKEIIFAKDYKSGLKVHRFSYDNIIRSMREDNESSSTISPSLSLVECFEYLDGSEGKLNYMNADGTYRVFDNLEDLFDNKDARLYGTIIYPGAGFKGTTSRIQAGVALWNGETYTFDVAPNLGEIYSDGGVWTGLDGPVNGGSDISNTGFYLRKMISDAPAASTRGTGAVNWWPWFRMGEIYLNAAEAAWELGDADAVNYINPVRERAGLPTLTNITSLDVFVQERRVELAFEDHRYFDLKRWRKADQIWNGESDNEIANIHGLYPYRIVREGHPDNNKYIYVETSPTRFRQPRYFRLANYYSSIASDVLNNNPALIPNPYHY